MVVEDVHWADATVLPPLTELAGLTGEAPIILALTSRIEGDPINQAWRGMTRGASLVTIDLGPLRAADATELARVYFDPKSAFVANCIERAEGNPLFLDQLLRRGEENTDEAIPGSVQSIVLARMDSLGTEDRRAIQAASVIGQVFSLEALNHVLDTTDYRCDGLIERSLVRPEGPDFAFGHALVRDGVYASLLGDARRALHAAAAAWFEALDPALYAEHLGRAGDPEAPRIFLGVAEKLASEHRYERALQLVEQGIVLASDKTDQFALACQRADLLQTMGDAGASIEAYREALDHAEDDAGKCEAWIGIAAGERLQGGREEGFEALDKAQSLTRPQGFERALARIHHFRGNFHFGGGEIEPCLEQQQLALEFAERADDVEWQARVLSGLGDAYYARCRMRTSLDYFQRCIALCREHGLISIEAANLSLVGNTRRYMNEWDGALEDVLAATQLAHRVGNRRAELIGSMLIGEFYLERGRYEDVESPLNDAMDLANALGFVPFKAYLLMQFARLRLAQGLSEDALSIVGAAMEICQESGERFIAPRVLGVGALAAADDSGRIEFLKQGDAILSRGCNAHNYLWFYRDAIEASLISRNWAETDRYAQIMDDYTHHSGVANGEPVSRQTSTDCAMKPDKSDLHPNWQP
jgi:tetratricopeptide (TPR) repeat protein